ncbi:amidase [Martelella radicis]|uniref:Asp-tRNA(Asn)/Glu-tRNA(Gln) amidotransferase A subunit family amidase n=1 Tax=Martelella radicis TaxID=1397476 RepID=A0A7W6P7M7_9HYPH|nr:amidase [Martelella radicis]MBB4120352.1 Asp-tRNA(Asn)/Glu-tRNA(Gln) amidotransferase A subunit family amidase [Martelella radicis]
MREVASFISKAEAFRTGSSSPVAVLEEYLATIEKREPVVKAFKAMAVERARKEAAASEARWKAGKPLSAIDGMPFGIKDILETEDMPTGQGSPLWEGFETRRDCASVQALRDAGALILGKTTTTEFASRPQFAETTNPHDPTRTPGGSSSGSCAAVGAGFVPLALGTQVVGSTLRPSSYCGAIGYKPSIGGFNRGGSYDYLSHSCTGLIGTTLEDIWATAKALVERTGGDPGYIGVTGPSTLPAASQPKKLMFLETDGWERVTPGAKAAFEEACAKLKAEGCEIIEGSEHGELAAMDAAIKDINKLSEVILGWEGRWPLNGYAKIDSSKLHPLALQRIERNRSLTLDDYQAALETRAALRAQYAALVKGADAVITLAATGAAPKGLESTGDPGFNIPASVLGVPGLSLPLLADEGMPLGLQLVGKVNEDASLFSHAGWIVNNLG